MAPCLYYTQPEFHNAHHGFDTNWELRNIKTEIMGIQNIFPFIKSSWHKSLCLNWFLLTENSELHLEMFFADYLSFYEFFLSLLPSLEVRQSQTGFHFYYLQKVLKFFWKKKSLIFFHFVFHGDFLNSKVLTT